MCEPATIIYAASAALSAYGAYNQAKSQKQSLEYQSKITERNAKVAEFQAQDAEERGRQEQQRARRDTSQMAGAQRAALAAKGLDLSSGSALSLLDDTEYFGQLDQNTIGDNSRKEAWGIRAKRDDYTAQAAMQRTSAANIKPGLSLASSVLSSASGVHDRWSRYKGV